MNNKRWLAILFSLLMLVCAGANLNGQNLDISSTPEKQIRLIALASPFSEPHWMLTKARGLYKDYTAQDVLEMIKDLKPDCLERFITGRMNPDELVPVREGYPEMTVLEFLNAAILAGSEKCHIVPKLNLRWLAGGREDYFWKAAQELYDLPLVRPIRNINLDVWDVYCNEIHTTPEQRAQLFKRLRDIGYEEIGVNMTGLHKVNDPQIDYADFNINKTTWEVNSDVAETIKSYPNIKKLYLYIDYPGAMDAFRRNSPDRQAEIYYKNIFPKQKEMGFTYVYAIIQDSWDANTSVTSEDGPYKGKTMYEITKELLNKKQGGFTPEDYAGCETQNFTYTDRNLNMRIDVPANRSEKTPFIIYVTGGSWTGGSVGAFEKQSKYLATRGIAGVRIAYTWVGNGGTFQLGVDEMRAAYDFAVSKAEELNLDVTRFGYTGASAGCTIAAYAAMTIPGCNLYIGCNGLYDLLNLDADKFPARNSESMKYLAPYSQEQLAAFSPIRIISTTNIPAVSLFHGTNDNTILYQRSVDFYEAVKAAGGRSEMNLYPGAGHGFFNAGDFESVTLKMYEFARSVFGMNQ